jgi:hypothetical protein
MKLSTASTFGVLAAAATIGAAWATSGPNHAHAILSAVLLLVALPLWLLFIIFLLRDLRP